MICKWRIRYWMQSQSIEEIEDLIVFHDETHGDSGRTRTLNVLIRGPPPYPVVLPALSVA